MHEVSIMQEVLRIATERAREGGAVRINSVRLRIGAMAGVVPEALSFAFEVMREDTMAATASLEVEYVPVTCWCETCGVEFTPPGAFFECAACGQPSRHVRRGRELELVSLEVTQDD